MWDRKQLKARGKAAFKANYWKCVLVALILMVLTGSNLRYNDHSDEVVENQTAIVVNGVEESGIESAVEAVVQATSILQKSPVTIAVGGMGLVGLALSILVFNPLIVGCYRFFLKNSRGGAELGELGAGFQGDWGNVVLTMFLRNLFIVLWGLLLVIPGIVKAYSYRMVPYLLKEHPELSGTQAITVSRKMMDGQKWNAFVLDLSFLGWMILSVLTLGILHIFYVGPYIQATEAELYEAVRSNYEASFNAQQA